MALKVRLPDGSVKDFADMNAARAYKKYMMGQDGEQAPAAAPEPQAPPKSAEDTLRGISNSPITTFFDQMSKRMPARRMADAISEGLNVGDQASLERAEASPGSAKGGEIVGDIITSIPAYMGGMGLMGGTSQVLGKLPTATKIGHLLMNMGKGAVASAGTGQLGRGLEFDPKATAVDAALGLAGEVASPAIQKGAELATKGGRGLYRGLFRAAGKDKELAQDVAGSLDDIVDEEHAFDLIADRAYNRGVWGTTKSMREQSQRIGNEARDQISETYRSIKPGEIKKTELTDHLHGLGDDVDVTFKENQAVADAYHQKGTEIWKSNKPLSGDRLMELRQGADDIVQNWKRNDDPAKVTAAKAVYRRIGKLVEKLKGDKIKDANLDFSFSKGMGKALAKIPEMKSPGVKALLATLGASYVNPAIGIPLGLGAVVMNTSVGRTGIGQLLRLLGKGGSAVGKATPAIMSGAAGSGAGGAVSKRF